MSLLASWIDRVRGQGEAAITVPVLDGPLMPNRALDEQGAVVFRASEVDNLATDGTRLFFSVGRELRRLDADAGAAVQQAYDSAICAIAAEADALAVGLADGGVTVRGGAHDGLFVHELSRWGAAGTIGCVTALCWRGGDELLVAIGSTQRGVGEWRRDLLECGSSGRVVRLDLRQRKATVVADRLAWPWGIALAAGDDLYVSEAWRHRIVALNLSAPGGETVVQRDLPAYPARIAPASGGGYWLSCVSIRNQLVEFILREREYCRRMIAEVPEPYWMAPALASGLSFKEPMQQNQLRQLGILKPWAPTRSYGLMVRCDERMRPLESFHSRADGRVHGVTATCDLDGSVYVCAKGAGAIFRLEVRP